MVGAETGVPLYQSIARVSTQPFLELQLTFDFCQISSLFVMFFSCLTIFINIWLVETVPHKPLTLQDGHSTVYVCAASVVGMPRSWMML